MWLQHKHFCQRIKAINRVFIVVFTLKLIMDSFFFCLIKHGFIFVAPFIFPLKWVYIFFSFLNIFQSKETTVWALHMPKSTWNPMLRVSETLRARGVVSRLYYVHSYIWYMTLKYKSYILNLVILALRNIRNTFFPCLYIFSSMHVIIDFDWLFAE